MDVYYAYVCVVLIYVVDAARVRRSAQRIAAASVYGLRSVIFFCSIFVESSEPIGLKFCHNVWIGPEGDNKEFHRDSFCSFLNKKK